LIHPLVILAPSSLSTILPYGLSTLHNAAMHGYSEVLYAFASATANNGSAFAGLDADTLWYNLALAIVIRVGRYPPIIFIMAVAGSVAAKSTLVATVGTCGPIASNSAAFGSGRSSSSGR
jgi:K+-transporting ATPase ATPase A chain